MARRRAPHPEPARRTPKDVSRRALIALAPFAAGTVALVRPQRAVRASSATEDAASAGPDGPTAHQQTYYDRARF